MHVCVVFSCSADFCLLWLWVPFVLFLFFSFPVLFCTVCPRGWCFWGYWAKNRKMKTKNIPLQTELTAVIIRLSCDPRGDDGCEFCFWVDCPFKECQLQMPVLYSSEKLTLFTKNKPFLCFFTDESVCSLNVINF